MAKRVLITGASGLLGREVLKTFTESNWDVLGLCFSRERGNLQRVDLCAGSTELEAVLQQFSPHVVIHTAAERRPDLVDNQKDKTVALNVTATHNLAELCTKRNIYLLYISTDYVFDGKAPPYVPKSPTNPINTYGVTKRDGENAVLQFSGCGVLRVPVLYGPLEYLGESAVTTLFSAVLDRTKPAKMSDYEQRYPTHVANCAQVCLGLAEKHFQSEGDASGIWHFSGQEPFTKYTMALAMAGLFGLSADHLIPVQGPSPGAVRPYDCHLDISTTESAVPITPILFKEGIKAVLEPFLP